MKEEGTGEPPLPKQRSLRYSQHAGDFPVFQAAEEAQLDYLGLDPVERLQSGQSLIDGDHVLQRNGRLRLGKLVHIENLDLRIPSAPFPRLFGAREIHQDLAHQARRGGKELAPVLPFTASSCL